jgi:hypothetical protein
MLAQPAQEADHCLGKVATVLTSPRTIDSLPCVTLDDARAKAHSCKTRGAASTLPVGVDNGLRSDELRVPPEQSIAIRCRTRR